MDVDYDSYESLESDSNCLTLVKVPESECLYLCIVVQ